MPRALVTGVQGQTGFYLAERLLLEGWEVHGTANVPKAINEQPEVKLHSCDFEVPGELQSLLKKLDPDLIVNLAAVSSVAESWKSPRRTFAVNTVAVAEIGQYLTEANNKHTRVVQASSSEIFGNALTEVCDESTPLNPINPYGVSKAASHQLGQTYRRAGFSWSNAILYNNESPRRPLTFLSRKVSHGVARISTGLQEKLELGDLSPARDWGWAPDYAQALLCIGLSSNADDYIVATGKSHTVEDFVIEAFASVGISNWQDHISVNSEYLRPNEVKTSLGSPELLKKETGWAPETSFRQIVREMVAADLAIINSSNPSK